MANKESETQQQNNSNKEWQEYMEARIRDNIMAIAPAVLESLGVKLNPPTVKARLKTAGAAFGIAVVGGVAGASAILYFQNRKARKLANMEFEKDANGHNRVRPVGGRAQSLVA